MTRALPWPAGSGRTGSRAVLRRRKRGNVTRDVVQGAYAGVLWSREKEEEKKLKSYYSSNTVNIKVPWKPPYRVSLYCFLFL